MAKARKPRTRRQPILEEGFLATAQAAKKFGMSAATLQRLVKEGRADALRIERKLRAYSKPAAAQL